jgi:hypothetical protein
MKKTIIVFLCLTAFSLFASCKKAEKIAAPAAFVVQSVIGDVKVERAGSLMDILAGQALIAKDAIVTGQKSTVDILCSSEGVIRINELSRMSIDSVTLNENTFNAALNLDKGKVFASIAKMKKDSSLSVKTPTAIAAVRGTSFRVSTSEKGSSVDVLSGKVQLNPVSDDKVVESVSTVVETNRTAAISVKEAKVMASAPAKKEITVASLPSASVEEIKTESSGISIAKTAPVDLKQELDSVGIKSNEVDVKQIPPDAVSEKAPEPVAEVKAPEPVKDIGDSKAEKALAAKQEKERLAKEKADKDKTEKERLVKEKADAEQRQRELAERQKAEAARIAKEKADKEQDQKESRVKNIPNM